MADVQITPRISCDNCNFTVDKSSDRAPLKPNYRKPKEWGSCRIEGSTSDAYGAKDELKFTDLCPDCATAIMEAAYLAAKARRGE